jgi:hypothetical protein
MRALRLALASDEALSQVCWTCFVLHRGIAHMIEIKAEVGVLSYVQRSVADASRNEVSKPILRTRWLDGRGRKQLTHANKL